MTQALPQAHDLLDELGLLDLNEDHSSDEEGMPASVDQEFSIDVRKEKLIPVQVKTVLSPNRWIVKLTHASYYPPNSKYVTMKTIFSSFKWKELQAFDNMANLKKNKSSQELYAKNMHVIVNTTTWDKASASEGIYEDDSDDDFGADVQHLSIGMILSSQTKEKTYQVFVSDLGIISTCTEFDICPIPPANDFLLENPFYALVTIPGIVPRKRMDHIPGLATVNYQDTVWNQGAHEDVQNWLSKYKIILLRKLIQDSPSFTYGDFYGATDSSDEVRKEDLFSAYLTRQKNAFFNYKLLNRIYVTKE